jgi:hypothetical protein
VYVAFGIQHAMHMGRWLRVTCPALQYFSALLHKRHDFREGKKLQNIKCVFWFSPQHFSETFIILRTERDMITNVYRSSCKDSCQILMKLEFNRQISENTQISNFMKIRPVGAEFFHAGEQVDGHEGKLLFAILRTRLIK